MIAVIRARLLASVPIPSGEPGETRSRAGLRFAAVPQIGPMEANNRVAIG